MGAIAVSIAAPLMPWTLAFAAGAMLFIISDEIIPETHRRGSGRNAGLISIFGGTGLENMKICVFCGSSFGRNEAYRHAAELTGNLLARRGIELIYGGGHVGLMGVVADAALAEGGRVTGVIPRALAEREIAWGGRTYKLKPRTGERPV